MTHVRVFLGKGGVGKTTCAAATALQYAQSGERTLVFGRDVYAVFSSFVDVPYPTFVAFMTSVLPGLNEEFMVDYVRRLADDARYRRIVWDTAPLGRTLALLGMPTMLAEHLRMAPRVYSRLRTTGEGRESIMQVLRRWESLANVCMAFLRESVRFTMVTIPEALALRQLDDAFRELGRYGLEVDRLIVNNVVTNADSPFLEVKAAQQQAHLRELRDAHGQLPITEIPLFPREVQGLDRVRQVAEALTAVAI